jgi:lipopolysaccharide transport system permease protein
MVGSAHIIQKIYFPRLILPLSAVCSAIVDFLVALGMLAIFMAAYRLPPRPHLFLLPLFALAAAGMALGLGFWFGALNVKYRDVKLIGPFLVRIGLYVSPVGFATAVVPEKWRFWYSLNPMVGIIDGFRWCILGDEFKPSWPSVALGLLLIATLLISGTLYFRATERQFADIV